MTAHEHARRASKILTTQYPSSVAVPVAEVQLATAHALTALALGMPTLDEGLARLTAQLRFVR